MDSQWQPIETAPLDGTVVETAQALRWGVPTYPLWSRYLDGRWCAEFGWDDWRPYEPGPTHWRPVDAPSSAKPAEGD